MPNYQISVSPAAVGRTLAILICCLLAASMLGQISRFEFGRDQVLGLVRLFNVNQESNIPTFFTVLLTIGSAMLLALIGFLSKQGKSNDSRYWFALAFGFLFLGYDEAFQVHEQLGDPVRQLFGKSNLGFLYFGWVVPAMIVVCLLALLFVKFLLRLPVRTRGWMLFAGCVYLSGCIGMELIGGKYFVLYGQDTLMYSFLTTIEEGLEMSGVATLIYALLGHIAQTYTQVEVHTSSELSPLLNAQGEFSQSLPSA